MRTFHPFSPKFTVISLGAGCAIKTEIIRRYFPEQPTFFFDYLGNFDGLDSCAKIINNDFQDFQEFEDFVLSPHPKWNTDCELKPISLCFNPPGTVQNILVSKHFPDIVFYHYPHTIDTLQSFKRKGERFRKLLQEAEQRIIFLYCRQYNEPLNGMYAENEDYSIHEKLAKLESEAIHFQDVITAKYPALPFILIALIMEPFDFHESVTPAINEFLQQKECSPDGPSQRIIYDRVFSTVPGYEKEISLQTWHRIYRRHLVTSPLARLSRASITLPTKWAKKIHRFWKKDRMRPVIPWQDQNAREEKSGPRQSSTPDTKRNGGR